MTICGHLTIRGHVQRWSYHGNQTLIRTHHRYREVVLTGPSPIREPSSVRFVVASSADPHLILSYHLRLRVVAGSLLLFSHTSRCIVLWPSHRRTYSVNKTEIWQGTLALMILKTLDTLGPLHGYGIARRIEQTSGDRLSLNYGTLYPSLLKLEQEGWIVSEWGVSENNRKAKYYKLTRSGRKQLEREAKEWNQTTAIVARFFAPVEEQS